MLRSALVFAFVMPTLASAHGALGISVHSVDSGSPAATAGLLTGDRLIRLDGQEVTTQQVLEEVMAAHRPGDTVPLTVEREGETVDLQLKFGERPGGGVSIGVKLTIGMDPGVDATAEPGAGTRQCLAWIEQTYRIDTMIRDLDLDLSTEYEAIRSCVGHDTGRMTAANGVKFCDSVFKVHCSGVDLLTEIGEAQVQQCEEVLSGSLGLRPQQYKGWKTCAQNKVFERYSIKGEASDEVACQTAFLETCGVNLDIAVQRDQLSPRQRAFVECCSADALGPKSDGDSGTCGMIDDGFDRGPCHDRPVCINRLSTEWISCSEDES